MVRGKFRGFSGLAGFNRKKQVYHFKDSAVECDDARGGVSSRPLYRGRRNSSIGIDPTIRAYRIASRFEQGDDFSSEGRVYELLPWTGEFDD